MEWSTSWSAFVALAASTLAIGYWLWVKRGGASNAQHAFNAEHWKPRSIRPLSKVDLLALSHLSAAVPECLVLPQVSLSRFIKVRQTKSYGLWFGRVGRRCVDFLVCSPSGDVLGVIEIVRTSQTGKPQTTTVGSQRKRDTLRLASIPLWQMNADQLADHAKLRQIILPELQAAQRAMRNRGFANTDLQPHTKGLEALELDDARWGVGWPTEDAGPSALLDEDNSGSLPLFPVRGPVH